MEKRTAVNKNNYKIKRLFFILLPFFFLSLFFYSCKTPVVKEEFNEVDPISLLDIDKSVYVSLQARSRSEGSFIKAERSREEMA